MRTNTSWIGKAAAVLAALAVAVLLPAAPANAQAASKRVVLETDATQPIAEIVPFQMMLRKPPGKLVTISWGDGTKTRDRSTCGTQYRYLGLCPVLVRHMYTAGGTFKVTATTKGGKSTVTASVASKEAATSVVPEGARTPAGSPPGFTPVGWEAGVVATVNAVRKDAGLNPVILCTRLNTIASDYANYQVTSDLASTPAPGRYANGGYAQVTWGEIRAYQWNTWEEMVNELTSSAADRIVINDRSAKHLGVAHVYDPSSPLVNYWVLEMASGGNCS